MVEDMQLAFADLFIADLSYTKPTLTKDAGTAPPK